ncbi:MAG: hypothetical protein ACFFCE_13660 [Promethearchaeota archaeon]
MRKKTTICIFLLSTLFIVPFGNFAKAQPTDFLGVSEGDEYKWKANINFEGVETLIYNMREIIVDQQNKLSELEIFGWEDLTINETIAEIYSTCFDYIFPSGWEAYNLSTVIEMTIKEYVSELNTSIFSGMIPSNWENLNITTLYDYLVDGLYASTGSGFENDPITELIELIATELNTSILYGLVPEGLGDLTLSQFYLSLYDMYIPGMAESYFLNSMISESFQMIVPPEILGLSIEEIINMLLQPYGVVNASTLFEELFLFLNSSIPSEYQSEPMSVIIDMLKDMIDDSLDEEYRSLSLEELINTSSNMYVDLLLPPELQDYTLVEIISLGLDQLLFYYDNYVLLGWTQFKSQFLQPSGLLNYEIGIKLTIDNIGTSEPLFPDGPLGVDLDVSLYYSLDFENWVNASILTTMLDMMNPYTWEETEEEMYETSQMSLLLISMFPLNSLLGFLTGETIIFDPSSYSNIDAALLDQIMYSGGLIIARNFDMSEIQTEITIETLSDPNCVEASIAWNSKGVLSSASIDGSGDEALTINLIKSKEIPGYGIPIILGLMTLTIIGVIYHIKRKYNT